MSEISGYQRFFAELKRRRVFRVMAVYGAVAFVILQVADIALPGLGLPEWTITLILALTILGFPIAIVLAWAFDMTPEGMQRTDKALPGEITQIVDAPAGNRWPVGLAAAGGTALLLVGAWLVLGRPAPGDANLEVDPAGVAEAAAGAPAPASIAVLPFTNLSGDDETQPFVDGLHDDLLTQLSKIGALTVISRTSVQEYRNTTKNVRDIADELGVATVLEGGVQRAGEQYRINVQLIDADTDAHLWAEQYSGELTTANIFDVQTRIATSITAALETSLTVGERESLERLPTEDLEAYELYQAARELSRANGEADLRAADRQVSLALERDSSFAEAVALKSVLASLLYWYYYERSDSVVAAADELSRKSLELAPGLAEGHWARGHFYYRTQLDYDRATEQVEQALRTRPGEADIVGLAGDILRRKGDMGGALARYRQAFELAPRDGSAATMIGQTLGLMREYSEGATALRRAIELDPGSRTSHYQLARNRVLAEGDTAAARLVLEEAIELGTYYRRGEFRLPELLMLERNPDAAIASLGEGEIDADNQFTFTPRSLTIGLVLSLKGDTVAARSAFDEARVTLEALVAEDPTEPRYRSALGLALAGLGRHEEAIRAGEEGLRLMPIEREAWRGTYRLMQLTQIYAMTGRRDEAIVGLERLLAVPSDLSKWSLRLDPSWDPLRGDPRFEALVAGD